MGKNKVIYRIEVIVPFTDIVTGKLLEWGNILETDSVERVRNILAQSLGKLVSVQHTSKKGKRVLIHQSLCYKIGGIETANRQIAKAFADYDITFLFNTADTTQVMELAKTCSVIIDDKVSHYETDVLILENYDSAAIIINRVKAQKIYQFVHTDWAAFKNLWNGFEWRPHEKIDKFVSVSETAQKGLKRAFGEDSVVCHNVLAPIDPKERRLVFVALSRATREKGIDRLLDFVNRLEKAGKDFVVFLCSTIEQLPTQTQKRIKASSKILLIPPSPYSQELLRSADYLVQLSLLESYCYSVREALQMQVPVIVSKIPAFEEIIEDGKNGYILKDDLSNLDVDKIFNKIPKIKPYAEQIDPTWFKVLEGEL